MPRSDTRAAALLGLGALAYTARVLEVVAHAGHLVMRDRPDAVARAVLGIGQEAA
ncbi:hypothetical protein AB0424_05800 [Streptomyces sp. NPDC051180]|uniref:hypothetical protein n=1 Tax=Streptomyces sp. NPDC051180 TaxID=3155797 RepID=UPI00344F3D87